MSPARITTETRRHVFLIGLNRPEKRNAFDLLMFEELARAYGELDRNPELRCGLLFAHGDHFTAGLELDQWVPVFSGGGWSIPDDGLCPLGLNPEKRCRKPVVIAVRGRCYTIGFELLLAQDIRVAATDARIALLEVRRGIYPVGGGSVRLSGEIGWGNAMRYLLTGDELDGAEAHRLGLVQELTEPGGEFDRALALATAIAGCAPLGVMAALKSARTAQTEGIDRALARLIPDLMPIMKSEDALEGLMSFIERREAKFKGR